MFYGRGAGDLPTGSAIVGDIIQAARNILHESKARWGCTCHLELAVLPIEESISKYYIRMCVQDRLGVFASLATTLKDCNVSMDSVMQKRRIGEEHVEIVLITHKVRHEDMMSALETIKKMDSTCEISNYIRVEDEE
jgi:homoserine dehydrogenase